MFHCALTDFDEIGVSRSNNGTNFVAQIPVGYDDSTGNRFTLLVALVPIVGYDETAKEFVAYLVENDVSNGSVDHISDARVGRARIVDPTHREAIVSAICQLTAALIDEAQPNVVAIITPPVPEKALVKYLAVMSTLRDKGYSVGKSDVWHGVNTWMLER